MIISHSHKFIFIKTKKTAGTSIEIALSRICGENDVLAPLNPEDEAIRFEMTGKRAQHCVIPMSKYSLKDWLRFIRYGKKNTFYNHIPASELKKYVSSEVWDSYYKFCFERDPLTKSISHYKWRGKKVDYTNYEGYLNSEDVKLIMGDYFYKDDRGNYLVDTVYKMEAMEAAFADIVSKIGVAPTELQAPAFKTKISKSVAELNPETIQKQYGAKLKTLFKTEYNDLYHG